MLYKFKNDEIIHPSVIIPYVIEFIDKSGLVRVAVDDSHFPQLENIGYPIEIIQFARFCLGAMLYENKLSLTVREIYDLINANIEEFISIESHIYEKVRIRLKTAEQVYTLLSNM